MRYLRKVAINPPLRAWWPSLHAYALIDIADVLRKSAAHATECYAAGKPQPSILAFVADSTKMAVHVICTLAEISPSRVMNQLAEITMWAKSTWSPADECECQQSILRWYQSKKVWGFITGRGCTDFIKYLCFVSSVRVSTAFVEAYFAHVERRLTSSATQLGHDRLLDMIFLREAGRVGPDPATSPLTTTLDGLEYLKVNLPDL
jgi:hypothetical protein